MMPFRGSPRGEPSGELPPTAFVSFIQNHDQIGNRAFGDRLAAFAPAEAVRAVSAVYLLLPRCPCCSWARSGARPRPSRSSATSVATSRTRCGTGAGRSSSIFRLPRRGGAGPDPRSTAEATFLSAKLDWNAVGPQALRRTQHLLSLRRERVAPLVAAMGPHAGSYRILGREAVTVTWTTGDGRVLRLDANLKAEPQGGFPEASGVEIWRDGEADDGRLGAWAVRWSVLP